MTDDTEKEDNLENKVIDDPDNVDPRIIEIVRFLARRAAEEDFAKAVAGMHNEADNNTQDQG